MEHYSERLVRSIPSTVRPTPRKSGGGILSSKGNGLDLASCCSGLIDLLPRCRWGILSLLLGAPLRLRGLRCFLLRLFSDLQSLQLLKTEVIYLQLLNLIMKLNSEERDSYLRALFAVMSADGLLDKQEVTKLYELFALFDIRAQMRREILDGLVANPAAFQNEEIDNVLLTNEELKISLAKDLLLMQERATNNAGREVAKAMLESISLTPKQRDVIEQFIVFENQILTALGAGEEWMADENSWKEWASRAAAVGVPLAALNFAGIAGFSAAGITSGLAALGWMSGLVVLGLNPMTAGIGALILGGVAVKKIADLILNSDDDNESSQFEEFKKE